MRVDIRRDIPVYDMTNATSLTLRGGGSAIYATPMPWWRDILCGLATAARRVWRREF